MTVTMGLGLLDGTHSLMFYRSPARTMSVEIVLANGWCTFALLLCCNMYRRRREAVTRLGLESRLVQCISFRTKIKFVRVQSTSAANSTSASPSMAQTKSTVYLPGQMQLVPESEVFDATNIVLPLARLGNGVSGWLRVSVQAVAAVDISLTAAGFGAIQIGVSVYAVD